MNDVLPAIDAWSTLRRFEESGAAARTSRRSSWSSSDASECSAFSHASDASSATSVSTTSTVSWSGTVGTSHTFEQQKRITSSCQQSDFSDEGYGSSSSQGSDGHLSEPFLASLDLGQHSTGTSFFRRPNLPSVPACTKGNREHYDSFPGFSHAPQQDSCSSLVQPIPRRTSASRSWSRPSLVRQTDRRLDFVEHLVDSATQLVALIWPDSATPSPAKNRKPGSNVIPLRIFIRETLRRSRTSYSTLQVTLYYLVLVKRKGGLHQQSDASLEASENASLKALHCGRRMFLAGLILASKYLQDRNFSARAWSKISGLPVREINTNEMAFLDAISWKLHIKMDEFNEWSHKVSGCTEAAQRGMACPWAKIMNDILPSSPSDSIVAPLLDTKSKLLDKFNLPTEVEPTDSQTRTTCGSSASAPSSRRPSWAPRQLSCENLSLNSRSSTPATLEPQCQVAPPAPSNLGRNLCTPQFTPWTASSSLSTPAESIQTQFSSCVPTSSVCQIDRTRCISWLARHGSVSSRSSSQSSSSSGLSGASHRWTYPPTTMATTTQTTGLPNLYLDKTPSLVTSPRSMSGSEDQSSIGFASEPSTVMQGYPSPPMSEAGPISPIRSETSRVFLRAAEETAAMPRPAFFPPRLPVLQSSRCPGVLSLMMQQTSCSSSASTTPTPTSFSSASTTTTSLRGIKRRSEENHALPNTGFKYAKFTF